MNQYPDLQLPLSVFAGGSGNDFHWMIYGLCRNCCKKSKYKTQAPAAEKNNSNKNTGFLNGVGHK
ncbi:MAG: hypothetical protein ACJ749_15440 [Flavisolibacter sp.]